MTPAVNAAKAAGIDYQVHEYTHDPKAHSWGLEAAEKLGLDPARVMKTLVVETDSRELVVAVLPVSAMLNLKAMAKAVGARKVALAEVRQVERSTGYVVGGVSPLGQRKRLRTAIDASAVAHPTVYVSGGRRGLDLELAPAALVALTDATVATIC